MQLSMRKTLIVVALAALSLGGIYLAKQPQQKKSEITVSFALPGSTITEVDHHSQVHYYIKKVNSDRNSHVNWTDLANAYLKNGRAHGSTTSFKKSEDAALKALKISPSYLPAKIVLASIKEAGHDFEGAKEILESVLKEDPSHLEAFALKNTVMIGLGRPDDAVEAANRIIEIRPLSAGYQLRGLAREASGDFVGAESDFIESIKREDVSDLEIALNNRFYLARLYLNTGKHDKFNEVVEQSGVKDRARFLGLLAQAESMKKQFQSGDLLAEKAFEKSRDPKYLVLRAEIRKEMHDHQLAGKLLADAIATLRNELEVMGDFAHPVLLAKALALKGEAASIAEAASIIEKELSRRKDREVNDVANLIAQISSAQPKKEM